MKKLVKILTVILALAFALGMVSCSKYNSVKKALEGIGYEVIETNSQAEDMQEESQVAVNPHVFKNESKLTVVIVFEFNKTEEMLEFYKDSNTMQGIVSDIKEDGSAQEFYNELVEKGYAKGTCLIMPIGLDFKNVLTAIKNA